MSAKITQDNLYMLLPLKIGWLAPWLSQDKGISLTAVSYTHLDVYKRQAYKVSKANDDFPDPETPVMATNLP